MSYFEFLIHKSYKYQYLKDYLIENSQNLTELYQRYINNFDGMFHIPYQQQIDIKIISQLPLVF